MAGFNTKPSTRTVPIHQYQIPRRIILSVVNDGLISLAVVPSFSLRAAWKLKHYITPPKALALYLRCGTTADQITSAKVRDGFRNMLLVLGIALWVSDCDVSN